jgi:hypothetical protein
MAEKFPGPKTRQALERGIPLFRNGLKFEAELEKAGRRGFRTAIEQPTRSSSIG